MKDEDDTYLGKVEEILTPAAHEVLLVKDGDEETLIPLVNEWVTDIDIENGLIRVNSAEEME